MLVKMPQGNSTIREQPSTALRRSPRLLHNNNTEPEDPKTPHPKLGANRVPFTDLSSLSSIHKVSSEKTRKRFSEKAPKKASNSNIGTKSSVKSDTGLRRSARLNGGFDGFGSIRRSLRLNGKGNTDGCAKKTGHRKFNQEGLSDAGKAKVGCELHSQFGCTTYRRATNTSNQRNTGECVSKIGCHESVGTSIPASNEHLDEEVSVDRERTRVGAISGEQFPGNFEDRTSRMSVDPSAVAVRGEERKGRDTDKEKKGIGVKRKGNQDEKGHKSVQGWTKDQELALQRAYLATKPTPHFWNNVAKLVPGKSAQDCFDKSYSDHLTPPEPQPRSRTNRTNSSFSLSASKLLESAGQNIKMRQKSHLLQRTVRQLLRHHNHVDKDCEADLFSVLESTSNPSTQAFRQGVELSTPECEHKKTELLRNSHQIGSSACKKHLLQLSALHGATLVSPPVLKQVRNRALHEKYIDQLHIREAKRESTARTTKPIPGKRVRRQSHVQKVGAIKPAKNSLVFYARDVINQFKHSKAYAMSNLFDADDDCVDCDDDEGEVGF